MDAIQVDVSRETSARLRTFESLLQRWTRKINLIAPADVPVLWERHILDCAQLYALAPEQARTWLDLGSGAGLPGLVIAMMAADRGRPLHVTLAESDQRKCAFLREAARQTGTDVTIRTARIEALPEAEYDVISARALAPLARLFDFALPHCHAGTVLLFPKGARVQSELTEAAAAWHSRTERITSRVHPDSTILKITELGPKHD